MTRAQRAALWILAHEVKLALHAQTVADVTGADFLRRVGKAWAARAARNLKSLSQRISQ